MLKQFLIDYSHDVIDGHVVACKKHIWACMRFLRDIDREGTDEFPYIFDEDRAMRFFEWMNLFKHTKGPLQGQYIEPHEIQYFVFGNIYGWIHRETHYRRFRYAYWQVGRKNAKSQSLACVASYEAAAMGESMAEVYCAATRKEQAMHVWRETDIMIRRSEDLADKFVTKYGVINHIKSDSVIKAMSKDDGKKGDGTNPQCGIVDEYHLHETSEMFDVIDSGMISRTQPLMMIITTAGTNLASPCYRNEYHSLSRVLDPYDQFENDQYFVMINEMDRDDDGNLIDDIMDEMAWLKANPIAASHPTGLESIRNRLKLAQIMPEKMDDFQTKNLNVWINAGQHKYMNMQRWAACGIGKEKCPDLKGRECYAGVDMSMKTDLSSVGFEFVLEDGSVLVMQHSWIPSETLEIKKKTDKVPYDMWIRDGHLSVIKGPVIDTTVIEEWIVKKEAELGIKILMICYDPAHATQFAQNMAKRGYVIVEIRQGSLTLSEPTKNFREMVLQKRVKHLDDPVLSWAVGNAVTKMDDKENMKLDKAKSTNRIDPIAAIIDAHVQALFAVPEVNVSEFADVDFLKKLWSQ